MKIKKTKSSKYPRKVTFDNGRVSPIPDQRQFKTDFIRYHGCSLAAFYIALRFGGKKKKMTDLLRWSKKNLNGYIYSKLTIKGVGKGLKKLGVPAAYHKMPTYTLVDQALKRKKMVLLELGNPIHTIALYRSGPAYRMDHGNVAPCDIKKLVNQATKSTRYQGCIIVG